jgi:hypothetical protein
MSDYDSRKETCPNCQATPHNMDTRILWTGQDPETGRRFVTETWHTKDCPRYEAPPEAQTTEHGQLTWGPGNPPHEERPTYLRPVRPDEEPTP